MADPQVPRHWVVALWSPPTDAWPLGQFSNPWPTLFGNLADAQNQAKELAALAPGSIYVVYVATWYAFTDVTPVTLLPVQGSVV